MHAREAALVAVTAGNLIFLPWSLGGMHVWSEAVSLALALGGFLLALRAGPAAVGPDRPLSRLVRFPVFWAGLALLAYVGIQGLNPAWRFVTDSKSWWLVPLPHAEFLPSGVTGPFERSNPWRAAMIWSSAWLVVCSVWVGFRRRLSFRILFGAMVVGGALLATVGLFQQMTGTSSIYWSYRPPVTAQFFASFVYRNHAGAFLNLILALAIGMAAWHWRRARRRLEGPGAAVAFGFAAALVGIAVISSASRMSFVLLIAFTLIVSAVVGFGPASDSSSRRHRSPWRIIVASAACILAIIFVAFRSTEVWTRIALLVSNPTATLQSRTMAREAAEEMFRARWVLGWGAGCFRYGFPLYQQSYPDIYDGNSGRKYWEHAHDDLLEFPLELGVVGMVPVLVMLGFGAWRLVRVRAWRNPLSVCAATGCLLTGAHAWVDFVFQNPAVLGTWAIALVGAIRWAEFESSIERRRAGP